MNVEDIRELYRAQPFLPFEIVLPNGFAVEVAHPKFMMFSPDYRTVHAVDMGNGGTKRIDVKMIVALNERPAQTRHKNRNK